MKKILITAANSAKAYQLAHYLKSNEIIFGDSTLQDFIISDENRSSYAHELLSLCLDNQIHEVYPLKSKEIKALAEAKILFKEYDIEVCIPDLLSLHKMNNLKDIGVITAANYSVVSSYQELSSKLLELGYPDEKFALGRLDDEGELLLLDDSQVHLNSVWTGLKAVSFLQMGKLFNHKDFQSVKIFNLEINPIRIDVIVVNNQVSFVQQLESSAKDIVISIVRNLNINGFFEVVLSGDKVLRIKCNTI